MKFRTLIFPQSRSRSILRHSDLLDYDHKYEDDFNPKAFWKWSRTPPKIICIINEDEIVHEKIQKIPSDLRSLAKFFILLIQFSILASMNGPFYFTSSLIFSFNLYISDTKFQLDMSPK